MLPRWTTPSEACASRNRPRGPPATIQDTQQAAVNPFAVSPLPLHSACKAPTLDESGRSSLPCCLSLHRRRPCNLHALARPAEDFCTSFLRNFTPQKFRRHNKLSLYEKMNLNRSAEVARAFNTTELSDRVPHPRRLRMGLGFRSRGYLLPLSDAIV